MREYGSDIHFICLEAQSFAKKQSSFKVFFITQLRHRHCLATIAFIVDIHCDDYTCIVTVHSLLQWFSTFFMQRPILQPNLT